MKKTILRRTNINGVDYLLPKREADYGSFERRDTKASRPEPNDNFAEFVEMGILLLLFAVAMVLSAF